MPPNHFLIHLMPEVGDNFGDQVVRQVTGAGSVKHQLRLQRFPVVGFEGLQQQVDRAGSAAFAGLRLRE
jgi:hypothetical protein